jgi:hypothetical protein
MLTVKKPNFSNILKLYFRHITDMFSCKCKTSTTNIEFRKNWEVKTSIGLFSMTGCFFFMTYQDRGLKTDDAYPCCAPDPLSAHAFSQSHALSQFAKNYVGSPHTFSQIVRKYGIARKCGLTLGMRSHNCEKVCGRPPHAFSQIAKKLWKFPDIFLKSIVSVFENGLFDHLTVNLTE